jgi:hypothetical protein
MHWKEKPMKVRVLYASAFVHLDKPPAGGDIVTVEDSFGKAAIAAGYAEEPKVERATAAPGEKRQVTRPRKKKAS